MRADLYLRQSMDRTGEELAVSRQRQDGRKLIESRGWSVRREYADNDRSAAGKKQREDFEALLKEVAHGQVEAIVAWSLDRLTRNRRDTVRLIEACQQHTVMIALVRGSDIDMSTPAGRMTADILSSVARHEIEQKSDRSRRAQEQAAEQGRRVGGRRPFGYADDGVTIREGEAAAIVEGYQRILGGGTVSAVARAWNEAGVNTGKLGWRTGEPTPWTRDTVRRVLLNPRNAGLRRYKGEIVGEAAWPAIVDQDTYYAVRSILTDPSRRTALPGRADARLLTGVALCGVCGHPVHAGGGNTYKRGYRIYRCSGSYGHVNRRADPIDAYVTEIVLQWFSRDDAIDMLVDEEQPDTQGLQAEAVSLRQRRENLATDLDIDEATLARRDRALRDRIAEIESQMADAGRVSVLGEIVRSDDPRAVWDAMGRDGQTDRQRAIVDAVASVRILPVGRGVRVFRPDSVELTQRG